MADSIKESRQLAQNQLEPAIYVPARWVSIHVSRFLVNTPISPNGVTLLWGISLLVASALFASGDRKDALVAASLVVVAYVLDCVDGELARIRAKSSNLGSTLEQMVHWVTNLMILAGVAIGLYVSTGQPQYLIVGLIAVVGDATFHFMYVSLRIAASPGAKYGILATITRWQFYLMPINTNLVLIGALVDRLDLAILIWAVWSNAAWIVAFFLFYRAELRTVNSVDALRHALEIIVAGKDKE